MSGNDLDNLLKNAHQATNATETEQSPADIIKQLQDAANNQSSPHMQANTQPTSEESPEYSDDLLAQLGITPDDLKDTESGDDPGFLAKLQGPVADKSGGKPQESIAPDALDEDIDLSEPDADDDDDTAANKYRKIFAGGKTDSDDDSSGSFFGKFFAGSRIKVILKILGALAVIIIIITLLVDTSKRASHTSNSKTATKTTAQTKATTAAATATRLYNNQLVATKEKFSDQINVNKYMTVDGSTVNCYFAGVGKSSNQAIVIHVSLDDYNKYINGTLLNVTFYLTEINNKQYAVDPAIS